MTKRDKAKMVLAEFEGILLALKIWDKRETDDINWAEVFRVLETVKKYLKSGKNNGRRYEYYKP